MPKSSTNNAHQARLISRFKQTIWVTVLLVMLAVLGTALFSFSTKIISVLLFNIIVMLFLFPMIKRKELELAKLTYLFINLTTVSYVIWLTGGLSSSSGILAYPMFIMVAALICSPKVFYFFFLFIISIVIAMGVTAINSVDTSLTSQFGYWNLGIIIILLSASGFTAWRFNNDMKFALKSLKRQIQKAKASNSKIEHLIQFDPLTNLPNRTYSEAQFPSIKLKAEEKFQTVSFLFLDIDNFKFVNDYYNHVTGDELLKIVARRLQNIVHENDMACRIGGDEFLLIITHPKNYNLEKFINKVLTEVSKPIEVSGNMIEITISIGIATYSESESEDDFEYTLKNADLAMYQAKEMSKGKNEYYFYDKKILEQTNRKLQIISGLKDALRNNNLELFLQPKIDLKSGKIHSAEALIRWVRNNPDNISPAEFIPLIESTELICDIGEWVIVEACRLCKHLHDNGFKDLSISVNISSAQFMRGTLENIIINALVKSKLSAQFLELELTEHILFKDSADVIDELDRLKALGLSLSIDDFGTGYSNLSYLSKFHVDSLKIDQSFIKDIHRLPGQFAIVDAIIKMGKSLGLTIIAEGVESDDEWDVLNSLKCDFGQGYLWSKPVDSAEFLALTSDINTDTV